MSQQNQKTILIVDDDPDILITTSSILKKRGFIPLEAQTAENALSVLENARPDLIITDVLLPEMNGYEFIKTVKASPFLAEIPILILTGRGQMKESFDHLGVNGFITKPFSIEELLERINEIFDINEVIPSASVSKKKILIVCKSELKDIVEDVTSVVRQFTCLPDHASTVAEAMAKVYASRKQFPIVSCCRTGRYVKTSPQMSG